MCDCDEICEASCLRRAEGPGHYWGENCKLRRPRETWWKENRNVANYSRSQSHLNPLAGAALDGGKGDSEDII